MSGFFSGKVNLLLEHRRMKGSWLPRLGDILTLRPIRAAGRQDRFEQRFNVSTWPAPNSAILLDE